MYGRASSQELMGKPLSDFLILHHPVTQQFMEKFIREGYRITDQESIELDAQGQKRVFRNTMVGTIVEWPNEDEIFHNVFSKSESNPFDLDLYKKGDAPKRVTFTGGKRDRPCVACERSANEGQR